MSIFRHFPELQVLELMDCSPVFTSDESVPQNGLEKLHTLRVHKGGFRGSLFQGLSAMKLESLHTLVLPNFADFYQPPFITFMKAHGSRLLHLTTGKFRDFNLFDVCNNLVDIRFQGMCPADTFACKTPHVSLTKIIGGPFPTEPGRIDFAMFPALHEIHMPSLRWPITERDISKNSMVPFAEYLLEKNIKVLDGTGKHWTPRLKSTRARKR
ncbi:hypothetical protein MSAN_01822700 [Mycena sanguinolenta]|uniref:Uncharacterized protein n=1 Tax=Mycena sanguinolenta TaxID=230812 RepID=A0A8H6XUV9_9AGAR|nr:hypothetical protein MSAN_01822700 [Mycena sanguinolenta]